LWEVQDRWATNAIVGHLDESDVQRAMRYLLRLPPSLDVAYALARQEHFEDALAVVEQVTPGEYQETAEGIATARGVIRAQATASRGLVGS
jgi:hypothetical protein